MLARRADACAANGTSEQPSANLFRLRDQLFRDGLSHQTARAVARPTPPLSQRLHPSQFAEGLYNTGRGSESYRGPALFLGSSTRNVEPRPGWLSTLTWPPKAWARCLTIERPRPVP